LLPNTGAVNPKVDWLMNFKGDSMAAELLAVSAPAYAAYASSRLLEKIPDARLQLGEAAFEHWKAHFAERIRELSVAVAESQPILFTSRINWSRSAFDARQVPRRLLRESLICLGEVLQEELPAFCGDEPHEYISQAIESLDQSGEEDESAVSGDAATRLSLQYLNHVLEGDSHAAIQQIVEAHRQGMSLEEAYSALMLAQREVGRMWHHAEINIAEEHLVTFTTERAMSVLSFHAERKRPNGLTVVSAAVANNAHDVGIRAVSDFFEFAGWRAVCLGGDLPAPDIASAAKWMKASLVLLSASLSTQLSSVRDAVEAIRDLDMQCHIMVGGSAFSDTPDLWKQLGADAFAATPAEAVTTAERLVKEGRQ
jgi:methanogenic corrinoid protein MtbC1